MSDQGQVSHEPTVEPAVAQPAVEQAIGAPAPAFQTGFGGNAVLSRRLGSGRPAPDDATALRAVAPFAGNAAVRNYVGGNLLARQGPGHAPAPPAPTTAPGAGGGDPQVTLGPAIWFWNLNARARPV